MPALLVATATAAPLFSPADEARALGTAPLPISVGVDGRVGNGPSGGAAISGDNRKARLVAFHSDASNLVRGDRNRVSDVFVWARPRGSRGLTLDRLGDGKVTLVSVGGRGGRRANGPSRNPSVDGGINSPARCVAFESRASNLAGSDRDRRSDVFVRDIAGKRTMHVSRGIRAAAVRPAIDGGCRTVVFEAGRRIYRANVGDGRARYLGHGMRPDIASDGSAVVWERGRAVAIHREGRTGQVAARGSRPRVSDREGRIWGVVFETAARLSRKDRNASVDTYTRVIGPAGGASRTDLVSATRRGGSSLGGRNEVAGITVYGAGRGFVLFVNHAAGGSTLYYRNNNTGNIDDLAHFGGRPGIADVSVSARGNFVAFRAVPRRTREDADGPAQAPQVFIKHLGEGDRL